MPASQNHSCLRILAQVGLPNASCNNYLIDGRVKFGQLLIIKDDSAVVNLDLTASLSLRPSFISFIIDVDFVGRTV